MTRTVLKTLFAGLAASTIGIAALTGTAAAGQSVITYAPTDPVEAQRLQNALYLYRLSQNLQNGASIRQLGMNNLAGIGQNGTGNNGVIEQHGNGHSATLQQNGNDNSYVIWQFGEGTNAGVVQNGNGQAGMTIVLGW
jgi:hypothetical protein